MADDTLIDDTRAFNRFYTRLIGVLDAGMHDTAFTLTEARAIFEIGKRGSVSHGELARILNLDAGYLTRLNLKLTDAGVIGQTRGASDRRSVAYALTREGDAVFAQLNEASDASVARLLAALTQTDREKLAAAMRTIRRLFGDEVREAPVVLRPHRIGDLGWLIHRQGILYNRQFGWDIGFEALIAGIYRDFEDMAASPPKNLWVAERGERVIGSVFVIPFEHSAEVAQLRMLYVEPEARGSGLGTALVQQATRFAGDNGYGKVRLWTQSVLESARRIYAAQGYRMVEAEPHRSFGKDLTGEIWEIVF